MVLSAILWLFRLIGFSQEHSKDCYLALYSYPVLGAESQ